MNTRTGFIAAFLAFFFWGSFPLYWKLLQEVPAVEILIHRMIWSLPFVGLGLVILKRGKNLIAIKESPRVLLIFTLTALLIAFNWGVYIWAINNDYVIEASLGYYINPLISILFGTILLRERINKTQSIAVLLAVSAVIILNYDYGRFPWIAISLALTFALYGLIKKITELGPIEGLFLETLILFPAAATYLWIIESSSAGSFLSSSNYIQFLLVFAGFVTALPLLLFAVAAKGLKLSTLGMMQYLAPTITFILGVFVFKEPFNTVQLFAFVLIWSGLALITVDGMRNRGN